MDKKEETYVQIAQRVDDRKLTILQLEAQVKAKSNELEEEKKYLYQDLLELENSIKEARVLVLKNGTPPPAPSERTNKKFSDCMEKVGKVGTTPIYKQINAEIVAFLGLSPAGTERKALAHRIKDRFGLSVGYLNPHIKYLVDKKIIMRIDRGIYKLAAQKYPATPGGQAIFEGEPKSAGDEK